MLQRSILAPLLPAILLCLLLVPVSLRAADGMDALAGLEEEAVTGSPVEADAHRDELGVVASETRLALRKGPGVEHAVIARVDPGTELRIKAESDGWLKVVAGDRTGWICGHLVWREKKAEGFFGRLAAKARDVIDHLRGRESEADGELIVKADDEPEAPVEPEKAEAAAIRRAADGGLDIPLFDQYTSGGRYPDGYCGPTSMKMVLAYFGIEKDIDHLALADVGPNTPTYTPGNGSSHAGLLEMLRHAGLGASEQSWGNGIDWLKKQTDGGTPCIVSVKGDYGAGFTTGGHILVVSGVTDDGRVILNDSVGGTRRIIDGATFHRAWTQGTGCRMAIACRPTPQA